MKLIKTCLLFLKVKPTKNWLLFEIGAFQLVNHTWPWKNIPNAASTVLA